MVFTIHLYTRTLNSNRELPNLQFVFHSPYVYVYFILIEQEKNCAKLTLLFLSDFLTCPHSTNTLKNSGLPYMLPFYSLWVLLISHTQIFQNSAFKQASWRLHASRVVRNDEHTFLCSYAYSVIPLDLIPKTQVQRFGEHLESQGEWHA